MRDKLGPYCVAMLLSAGALKANPLLAWIPIDLTALSALLVLVFVLLSRISDGPASGFVALPLGIWILLSVSILAAVGTEYAHTKLITLFTVTLALAISPFYLLRGREQRRAFLAALVVISGFGLLSLLWGGSAADQLYGRLVLEGSDTIITARVAVTGAIILLITALLAEKRWILRVLALAAAGMLLATAFMTGSRGPAISAVVALLAVAVCTPAFRRFRLRAIALLLVVVSAVVLLLSRDQNVGLRRIFGFLSSDSGGSREVRSFLWETAIERMQHTPWGSGLGSFAQLNDYGIEYPHNLFLEVGFELGWIPLVLLIALILVALVRGARGADTPVDAAFFGLLTFSFLGAMVSSDMNGSRLLIATLFAAFAVSTDASTGMPCTRSSRGRFSRVLAAQPDTAATRTLLKDS